MILHLDNEQFEANGEFFLFTGEVVINDPDELHIICGTLWRQDTSMPDWGEFVNYLPFVHHIESLAINHYENRQFRQPMFK